MSRDLGRDVPDLEKLYARKLWADFSYPTKRAISGHKMFSLSFFHALLWEVQEDIPRDSGRSDSFLATHEDCLRT